MFLNKYASDYMNIILFYILNIIVISLFEISFIPLYQIERKVLLIYIEYQFVRARFNYRYKSIQFKALQEYMTHLFFE